MTDGSGNASDNFTYAAWGDVLNSPPNNQRPYQYVGKLGYYKHTLAQGTALADILQLGQRFYDPQTGRFMQRDPIGYGGGLNQYTYVNESPTTGTDPIGLKAGCVDKCKTIASDLRNINTCATGGASIFCGALGIAAGLIGTPVVGGVAVGACGLVVALSSWYVDYLIDRFESQCKQKCKSDPSWPGPDLSKPVK